MLVNLHLTHKCNLRCTYCYTGDKTLPDMSDQTLADSFAFMEGLADREITLAWRRFGGRWSPEIHPPLGNLQVAGDVLVSAHPDGVVAFR